MEDQVREISELSMSTHVPNGYSSSEQKTYICGFSSQEEVASVTIVEFVESQRFLDFLPRISHANKYFYPFLITDV